ncbi:MAG: hypothetical protein PHT07_11860 [Paludibacter sp.]|nr:hypothetical protein [Paludibacter sp.]
MKNHSFIALYFLFLLLAPASVLSQGLLFHANDELISKRTSYSVFESTTPTFEKYFTLKFDLSVIETNPFGYICFIRDKNTNISYSLIITRKDDLALLQLNIDSKQDLLRIPIKMTELGYRKWHSVSMTFLLDKNYIEIGVDHKLYKTVVKNLSKKFSPQVLFGKHDYIVDFPKMAIRNLIISGDAASYTFNFNESEGSAVHDSTGEVYGKAVNPIWLIKESYHWQLRYSGSSNKVAAVNFDPKHQRMILVNSDSVRIYDFNTNRTSAYKFKGNLPVPMRLGMSFIDTLRNKLYVYEVNNVPEGKASIASLDLTGFTWNIISKNQLDYQRHHHTGYLNPEKLLYTIFGGFGNQKYSKEFNTLDIQSGKWLNYTYSGDEITPRFFSGQATIDKDNTLIFGGIGNKTGDQNLGKSYNYDCYQVNYTSHSVKKLWSIPVNSSGLVTVRNMVLSEDKNSVYTLCYAEYLPNTFLKLYEFSIKDGSFKILGDSIPMVSERIETNANLYRNPVTKELYCTTQEFSLDGSSRIKIYSLSGPPVTKMSLANLNLIKKRPFLSRPVVSVFILVLLGFVLIRRFISYRKKRINDQKTKIHDSSAIEEITQVKRENSIYLFGEFTVIDKSGRDITYLFSSKVKQLFLFILLNSENNGHGVKSSKIYSTVWPDKPLENAKNLKGVTLSQIRKILVDIHGIELVYTNEYFRLEMQEPFYCDYLDCQKLFEEFGYGKAVNDSVLQKVLAIVSQGPFLDSVEFEYLELYKREFKDQAVTVFSPMLTENFKERNYVRVILISQIIHNIDELNKTALSYELVAYQKTDMKDMIQKRYNSFIIKYKIKNKKEYPYSMSELLDPQFLKKHS